MCSPQGYTGLDIARFAANEEHPDELVIIAVMRHLLLTAFNLVCTIYTAVNASPLPSARDDDCTVFVPSLGDNPIFISGESNTITWYVAIDASMVFTYRSMFSS